MDHLSSLTDEELDALEPEEIEQGFRLGCQTKIKTEGNVTVTNKPYFWQQAGWWDMNDSIYVPLPASLHAALAVISERTRQLRLTWLVGGSTGLMLQGVPLTAAPRDLDLYIDREQANLMHKALSDYAVDEQVESETAIYRSILSHYEIGGVNVELVGAFVVHTLESVYTVEAAYLAGEHVSEIRLADGEPLMLMPLVHELVFNLLRARPDRYEAIADICRRQDTERHMRTLTQLAARNHFSPELTDRLWRLLS
jgi:hypothetical protein